LSVAAVLFVYRLGWRALRRYRGGSKEGLVLGALLGFTAVVVHSAVDFGLRVLAVVALTVAVGTQVATLSKSRTSRTPRRRGGGAWPRWPWPGQRRRWPSCRAPRAGGWPARRACAWGRRARTATPAWR